MIRFLSARHWVLTFSASLLIYMGAIQGKEKSTVYSIPAAHFLAELKHLGIVPAVRVKKNDNSWEDAGEDFNKLCSFSTTGVLKTEGDDNNTSVILCEFSLFSKNTTLSDGWTLKRVHWSGDLEQAVMINNPTNSNSPFIRIHLPLVLKHEPETKIASYSIAMLLVVLETTEFRPWQEALTGIAYNQ